MRCDQKLDIRWECVTVNSQKGETRTFWQMKYGDTQVLVETPEGSLIKNETGRKPLTFGKIDEEIKGKFGHRKSY